MSSLPRSRPSRPRSHFIPGALVGSLALLSGFPTLEGAGPDSNPRPAITNYQSAAIDANSLSRTSAIARSIELEQAATMARSVSQSCHLFPEPGLLDKETWEREALPFMSKWLGISKMNLDLRPGRKYVEASGVFPTLPIVSAQDWEAIGRYYIESAPAKPPPQAPHP